MSLILSDFKKGLILAFRRAADEEAMKTGNGAALKEDPAATAQSYARSVGRISALSKDAIDIIEKHFKQFNREEE